MRSSKYRIWKFSVRCTLFLVFCTVLSFVIDYFFTAQVVHVQPQQALVNQSVCDMVLPTSCVYFGAEGAYVFGLEKSGAEYRVKRKPVTVIDTDGVHTAISISYIEKLQVAAFPSKMLNDGDKVRVII